MNKITKRIEDDLGLPGLTALLASKLAASDLQSLLLEIHRLRVVGRSPPAVLADHEASRFVKPAPASPRRLLDWDRVAFALLPEIFEPVELSPVSPLGTCSVVAGVAQNWAVATERNNEVVADSTNSLALEAARRRRQILRRTPGANDPVHLAASHRVLRAQRYDDPTLLPHFRLFALCSAGRDEGGLAFEARTLALHVRFHLSVVRASLGPAVPLRVALTLFAPLDAFVKPAEALFAELGAEFPNVDCGFAPERTAGRGYYQGLCFHVFARDAAGQELQLADGGAVSWTARLLSDAKERLLISGLGSERLCSLADAGGDAR